MSEDKMEKNRMQGADMDFHKSIIESFPVGYAYHKIILDENNRPCDYEFIEVNNAFENLTGLKRSDILGKNVSEVLPDIKKSEFNWIKFYGNIAINGGSEEFEKFSESLERWYKVKVYSPEEGTFITIFTDITIESNRIKDFDKLSVMSEELLQGFGENSDYQKITNDFLEITNAKFAIFNLYDEDGKQYTTMAIAGDRGNIEKALNIIGMKLEGKKWVHDPVRADKIKDKVVTRFPTLHNLAVDVIPKHVCDLLTKSFGLGETVLVKIMKNNIMLGDFTLIMARGKAFDKDSIVELYAKQVGLAIGKLRVEEALNKQNILLKIQQDVSLDGILVVDDNDKIISFNQRFSDIWGIPDENMASQSGEKALNYVLPKLTNPEAFVQRVNHLYNNKQEQSYEEVPLVDGRILERYSAPMFSQDKRYYGRIWYYRDITQRKQAEEALLESKEQLETLSDNIPNGLVYLWTVDPQGNRRFIYVSAGVEQLHGVTQEEVLNNAYVLYDQLLEDDRQRVFEAEEQALTSLETFSCEARIRKPDGEIRWLQYQSSLSRKPDDSIVADGIAIDITDRKQAEEALRESETRYRKAQELGKVGNWEYNLNTTELWGSDEAKKMYGFEPTKDSFSIEEVESCIIERERVHQRLMDLIENSKPYNLEFNIITKNTGNMKTFVSIAKLEKDEEGKPQKVSGVIQDITDRKEIEHQLLKEKEQFKTTLLSVGDGIISTDAKGNVVILSPIAEQLTGWTKEEAVGKSSDEVFHIINEFTRERCDNPVQKVFDTGETTKLEYHTMLISKDGIERPIEDSAAPIKDEKGNITGVVLVFRDCTEKKKSQDEIKYLSFHDHLTGLYNRRFFEAEVVRLDTERNLPITIIMGDVNGLKLINDSFGHSVGDELLIRIAKVLKKSCRADEIIARVGGDEYAIILPKTNSSEAQKLINRTIESLKREKVRDLDVSISFGWATKTDMSQTTDLVTKKAEDHMYNNKLFEGPSVRGRVIDSIVATINSKSPREQAHSERVSELCVAIGKELKLEEGEVKTLKVFGLLHDIGKIAIADAILNKPDGLTDKEYNEIKRHSEIGFRILSTANDITEIADYVLYHHERWDGKGYPIGLKGDSIPLPSRICALADAYDAMTSDRSYRPAMTNEFAVEELQKNSGTQFDSELVDVFVEKVLPTLSNRFS